MKKVVFTFGRLNPPTIGHQKLVDKVESVARKEKADAKVYLSHTQNNKKDPLDYNSKYKYASAAFGKSVVKSNARQPVDILKELEKQGYTDVIMIVGSDRLAGMGFIKKYNGKEYKFNSIQIMSAGERDPDAEGVEGMSASKMRAAALSGDFEAFKSGLPPKIKSSAKRIYDQLRQIMETESLEEAVMDIAQRRARGRLMKKMAHKMQRQKKIRAKKMADTNKLMQRSQKAAKNILRQKLAGERGENYAQLGTAQKIQIDKLVDKKSALIPKIAKKLLPKVRKAEIARVQAARGQSKSESMFDWETDPLVIEVFYDLLDSILEEIKHEEKKSFSTFMEGAATDKAKEKADKEKQDLADKHAAEMERATEIDARNDEAEKEREAARAEKEQTEAQDPDIKDREGTQPKKYFSGLAKSTKAKRDAQFQKAADKDSSDPSAYPDKHIGDTKVKTKTSKHTKKYHDMYGEEFELTENSKAALMKKADKSGIPYSILKKVYDRGMAAWRTGHRPGAGQEQWAYARVNSFITKGKGTWGKADADLAAKVKKMKEEVNEAPRWLGIPVGKAVYKKQYQKAKEVLQSIIDRKKKEGTLKHDALYYAAQVAKQFTGVDARSLATMVEAESPEQQAAIAISKKKSFKEMMKKPSDREWGKDSLTKSYKDDTPGEKKKLQACKEALDYHNINSLCIKENIYRPHSEMYYQFFREARLSWALGETKVTDPFDLELLRSDIGEHAIYEGVEVPLDIPMMEEDEKDPPLNKPKRGGAKKFYVYVKNDKGNVVKVQFGDTSGLDVNFDDEGARKSFVARHNCDQKNDKTKPGYWSCRLPRYAKELGLKNGGSFFW